MRPFASTRLRSRKAFHFFHLRSATQSSLVWLQVKGRVKVTFPPLTKLFLRAVTEKSGTKRSVQLSFVCFNFTGHTPGMFVSKLQLKLTKNKKLLFLTNTSCLKIFSHKRFRFTFVTVSLLWILNAIAIWTFFDLVSVSLRSPRKTKLTSN